MDYSSFETIKKQIHDWIQLDYIEPSDIPAIELYMDQVTTFMDKHLQNNKRTEEDKTLTKTMINNYTKNDLLPPPNKKKYSKDHIILLIYIYYLKNFISISDIQLLLTPMIDKYYNLPEKSDITLDSIYSDIFELEHIEYQSIKQSIYDTYQLADKKFPASQSKESQYLHDFAFITLLSYDIYLKKQLIERMIDDMASEYNLPTTKKEKKEKSEKTSKSELENQ